MHANIQREVLASLNDHESWFDIKVCVWSIYYDKESLNHPQTSLYYISESFPFLLTQTGYMQELSKSTEFWNHKDIWDHWVQWNCGQEIVPFAQLHRMCQTAQGPPLEADLTPDLGLQLKFFVVFRSKQTKYSSWKFERNSGPRETNWCRMVFPLSNLTCHWSSHSGPRRGLM